MKLKSVEIELDPQLNIWITAEAKKHRRTVENEILCIIEEKANGSSSVTVPTSVLPTASMESVPSSSVPVPPPTARSLQLVPAVSSALRVEAAPTRGRKSTLYHGVSKYGSTGRWQARITINGVQTRLGVFAAPEDAARAWDAAALQQGIDTLNFPLNAGKGYPQPEHEYETTEIYRDRLLQQGFPANRVADLINCAAEPLDSRLPPVFEPRVIPPDSGDTIGDEEMDD